MNFYPHHIKDFNNSTRHLTRVERSVYRDAIELYYDTESVLFDDVDKLSRRLLCVSEEEKIALKTVLSEFFIKTDGGFFHERCESEISKYRANTSAKARAGQASAAKRKQNSTDAKQMLNTCTTDEQLTSNQEPRTNNQEQLKDKSFCTEQKSSALEAKKNISPVVIELPLNKAGTFHEVTQSDVDECLELYPAADIVIELKKMRKWLNDNPTRKKTKGGINKFITGWLSKVQNNPAPNRSSANTANYGEKQVNGLKDAYMTFGLQEINQLERIGHDC